MLPSIQIRIFCLLSDAQDMHTYTHVGVCTSVMSPDGLRAWVCRWPLNRDWRYCRTGCSGEIFGPKPEGKMEWGLISWKITHLHECARCCCQSVNGHSWNHGNARTRNNPAQNVGPRWVHVFLVCQRLVAYEPIHYDELRAQERC